MWACASPDPGYFSSSGYDSSGSSSPSPLLTVADRTARASSPQNSKLEEGYNLRPRFTKVPQSSRAELQSSLVLSGKRSSRPAPLSKYRRKNANARERSRMQEINDAFERLREALPDDSVFWMPSTSGEVEAETPDGCDSGKYSKINTLRRAMVYITALARSLSDDRSDGFAPPSQCKLDVLQEANYHSVPITEVPSSPISLEYFYPGCTQDLTDLDVVIPS